MAVVLFGALAIGANGGGPPTPSQRAHHIASEIRCPTCRGLSAAESDAAAARAVRDEIRRRVGAGESDATIRSFLASRYGSDILLRPGATGVAGLVWAIPAGVAVVTLAGLAAAFRKWGARPGRGPTEADRALVDEALRR